MSERTPRPLLNIFPVEAYLVGRSGRGLTGPAQISTIVTGKCKEDLDEHGQVRRGYRFDAPFIVTRQLPVTELVIVKPAAGGNNRIVIARVPVIYFGIYFGIATGDSLSVGMRLRWPGSIPEEEPSIESALQRGREAFE